MRNLIVTLVSIIAVTSSTSAQLFKRIQNSVQDKIERKVEDKIVEEVSEEIARQAMKPIDKAFDDMFRRAYKDKNGEEYDDSEYDGDPQKQRAMMRDIMSSMYGNVDLPDSYDFQYSIDIEVYDYGEKKPNHLRMLVAPQQEVFGLEQKGNKQSDIMVFDMSNDQVIMFNQDDKTFMAIPNVMKMAGAFANVSIDEELNQSISIDKINKLKNVAGYSCQGYKYQSEDEKGEFFNTTSLPFDWHDTFGGIIEQMSPNFYKDHPEYNMNGMLMYAENKRNKDGKKSKWEVKNIANQDLKLLCSQYTSAVSQ